MLAEICFCSRKRSCGVRGWWRQIFVKLSRARHVTQVETCKRHRGEVIAGWRASMYQQIWSANVCKGRCSMPNFLLHHASPFFSSSKGLVNPTNPFVQQRACQSNETPCLYRTCTEHAGQAKEPLLRGSLLSSSHVACHSAAPRSGTRRAKAAGHAMPPHKICHKNKAGSDRSVNIDNSESLALETPEVLCHCHLCRLPAAGSAGTLFKTIAGCLKVLSG